jgi:phosphatidylinositol kinase/protein kinase (PI-3  family)
MCAQIPSDLLRRRLHSSVRAECPEALFAMRDSFVKTLASSNLFAYILGLGDRHLDNLLLDVTTGSIVQIDFGVCFGMGASVLPVPELIPFRLTPQLQHVLLPVNGSAMIRHYMIKCMSKLRAEALVGLQLHDSPISGHGGGAALLCESSPSSVLTNALEVYVNDPVLDWIKGLSRAQLRLARGDTATADSGGGDGSGNVSGAAPAAMPTTAVWEPRRRISAAIKKVSRVVR